MTSHPGSLVHINVWWLLGVCGTEPSDNLVLITWCGHSAFTLLMHLNASKQAECCPTGAAVQMVKATSAVQRHSLQWTTLFPHLVDSDEKKKRSDMYCCVHWLDSMELSVIALKPAAHWTDATSNLLLKSKRQTATHFLAFAWWNRLIISTGHIPNGKLDTLIIFPCLHEFSIFLVPVCPTHLHQPPLLYLFPHAYRHTYILRSAHKTPSRVFF